MLSRTSRWRQYFAKRKKSNANLIYLYDKEHSAYILLWVCDHSDGTDRRHNPNMYEKGRKTVGRLSTFMGGPG